MDNSVIVSLRDIVVEFDGQRILDGLNLDIHDKEFVTLLGPSGCGKTTTLRIIGGFLTPTSGTVTFDGKTINDVPPYRRQINTVFQRYALFPHLDVYDQGLRIGDIGTAQVLHISPGHHFPTGLITPQKRRREMLDWAKKTGGFIIEDDYDSELRFSGRPIPPLQSIDSAEKVIYINTFSKTLAPTFRISYMVLPAHLASLFYEKLGFYSCTVSNFEQFTLAKFIEDGYFERHINRMRTYYRTKRDRLLHYLATCKAAPALTVEGENSGLHFLLHLATQASDTTLTQAALAQGIQIKFLSDYYHAKTSDRSHTLLMNYTGLPDDELYPALEALFSALEPYLEL